MPTKTVTTRPITRAFLLGKPKKIVEPNEITRPNKIGRLRGSREHALQNIKKWNPSSPSLPKDPKNPTKIQKRLLAGLKMVESPPQDRDLYLMGEKRMELLSIMSSEEPHMIFSAMVASPERVLQEDP